MLRIKVHEQNMDTSKFKLAPEVLAVFEKLKSSKEDTTGIPGLSDIVGLTVASWDGGNWVRYLFYFRVAGKEYKNPSWATSKKGSELLTVVNDPHISKLLDDSVENFIRTELPQAELVDVIDRSDAIRPSRRYIYDMGDSRLYMTLDVGFKMNITDVQYKEKKEYVAQYLPALECTLYEGATESNGHWTFKDKCYNKMRFNFSKDMPSLKEVIDDVYKKLPRTYSYMLASSLNRRDDLEQYGNKLKSRLSTWAKSNGIEIRDVRANTDHDDYYLYTLYIDTYNTYYKDIAKYLEDEKKNAPGWVDYGISGLH